DHLSAQLLPTGIEGRIIRVVVELVRKVLKCRWDRSKASARDDLDQIAHWSTNQDHDPRRDRLPCMMRIDLIVSAQRGAELSHDLHLGLQGGYQAGGKGGLEAVPDSGGLEFIRYAAEEFGE